MPGRPGRRMPPDRMPLASRATRDRAGTVEAPVLGGRRPWGRRQGVMVGTRKGRPYAPTTGAETGPCVLMRRSVPARVMDVCGHPCEAGVPPAPARRARRPVVRGHRRCPSRHHTQRDPHACAPLLRMCASASGAPAGMAGHHAAARAIPPGPRGAAPSHAPPFIDTAPHHGFTRATPARCPQDGHPMATPHAAQRSSWHRRRPCAAMW